MSERWPGYNRGAPPPGAEVRILKRGGRARHWSIEVWWTGLDEPIDLGAAPAVDYMTSRRPLVDVFDWAAIADDHLPEPS